MEILDFQIWRRVAVLIYDPENKLIVEMGTTPRRSAVDFRQILHCILALKILVFFCGYDFGHDGSVYLPFIIVGEVSLPNCCICFIYVLDKEFQSHVWIFLENYMNSHF
jgi:hypothetical protein